MEQSRLGSKKTVQAFYTFLRGVSDKIIEKSEITKQKEVV